MNLHEMTEDEQHQVLREADARKHCYNLKVPVEEPVPRRLTLPVETAHRADPYGEFADVQAVTVRNAGLLLREAVTAQEQVNAMVKQLETQLTDARKQAKAVGETVRRAEYRLQISALQPNGGEA